MRRLLQQHRWITALVACLLLFATSGLSLSRMTCLMGGQSVLSVGQGSDCCPREEHDANATIQATCCAITQIVADHAQLLQSTTLDLDVILIALDAAPMMVALAPVQVPLRWLDSRPPPLAVPDRLASLRVLLI